MIGAFQSIFNSGNSIVFNNSRIVRSSLVVMERKAPESKSRVVCDASSRIELRRRRRSYMDESLAGVTLKNLRFSLMATAMFD